jgi:hypothetical protein
MDFAAGAADDAESNLSLLTTGVAGVGDVARHRKLREEQGRLDQ